MSLARSFRFLAIFICAGIVLPKLLAFAIYFHPGIQTTVICTGQGMITVRIGPDGQPIEHSEEEHASCIICNATIAVEMDDQLYARSSVYAAYIYPKVKLNTPSFAELALFPDPRGPPHSVVI